MPDDNQDPNEQLVQYTEDIMAALLPMLEGKNRNLVITAMINATAQVVMMGMECDAPTAVAMIQKLLSQAENTH